MSRGDGSVMRAVVERLTDTPTPIEELACDVFGVQRATRAQVETVRRAVKRLIEQERADAFRHSLFRLDKRSRSRTRSTLNTDATNRGRSRVEAKRRRAQALMKRI